MHDITTTGHAPGHLRDWFEQLVENGAIDPDTAEDGQQPTEVEVLDALTGCTDTMPRTLCGTLDLEPGSTYAEGVNVFRGLDVSE